jgi:hypothetical protein
MINRAVFLFIGGIALVGLGVLLSLPRRSEAQSLPEQIVVRMWRLQPNGLIYYDSMGERQSCATPEAWDKWGCTAIDRDLTAFFQPDPTLTIEPALYPYRETPAPVIDFESDYLPDVVTQEIGVSYSHLNALKAQAVAARSYAIFKVVTSRPVDNSIANQAFLPYRFELLRLQAGDHAFQPGATATPDPLDCEEFAADGVTRDQRKLCDALRAVRGVYLSSSEKDQPIFAEYSSDIYLRSKAGSFAYLHPIDDPISYLPAVIDLAAPGHNRGMSQNGANRWARGSSSRFPPPAGRPWSVSLAGYEQILSHYYSGVELRDSTAITLTAANRWLPLRLGDGGDWPAVVCAGDYALTVWLQNAGVEDWQPAQGLVLAAVVNEGAQEPAPDQRDTLTDTLPLDVTGLPTARLTTVLAAGDSVTLTLALSLTGESPTPEIDLDIFSPQHNQWFSQQEKGWPPYRFSVNVLECTNRVYLPLIVQTPEQ